jgi:hypothetical protein
MKLRDFTIERLAEMVIGDHKDFPYRSSWHITRFFQNIGLDFTHDGSTRARWAKEVLTGLNNAAQSSDLPSDELVKVITGVFDEDYFDRQSKLKEPALTALNELLKRDHLTTYFDEQTSQYYVRNTGTGAISSLAPPLSRPLTKQELEERQKIEAFLDSASEDEFTEQLLVPFFQASGFQRVSPGGHKEKLLEFGKDLWMKLRIPTGHWIYFGVQVKRGKIDSSGVGGSSNVANILTQVKMGIDHPIFDPDMNKTVLLDHMFVIAAGDITRAARTWLVANLDASQRRHILFMDRAEFLENSARVYKLLHLDVIKEEEHHADQMPF